MEFDTRTLKNPESEDGWLFNKVYDLLKFLRQLQFATDTNVGGNLIDRQAALDAIKKLEKPAPTAQHLSAIFDCEDTIKVLPPAQPGWIPCSEKMPPDYQWYYATCKSLVDNRENWVVEGCYTPWEHFNSTPMIKCGQAEVIAWMPKEFPEPWEGEQDERM